MRKNKKFTLLSATDIKVFLLFLLDNIGYPIEHSALIDIIADNTDEISLDYDECLSSLSDDGHLLFDEFNGEKYYMISDTGRDVASILYDRLDADFRESIVRYVAKYMSLSKRGGKIKSAIKEEGGRFVVTMSVSDETGSIMSASLTVLSRAEAERIKKNFETKPDGVYRGILFSATGRLEFLS